VEMYSEGLGCFIAHMSFEMILESCFWHDVWCGKFPLKLLFP
jgi:hypothetical protein